MSRKSAPTEKGFSNGLGLGRREFLTSTLAAMSTSRVLAAFAGNGEQPREQYTLVPEGKPLPRILKGNEDDYAADHLAKSLQLLTGKKIDVKPHTEPIKQGDILVGSPDSNHGVAAVIKNSRLAVNLEPEGFLLKTLTCSGPILSVAGADRVGTIYGVNELVQFYLESDGKTAWVPPLSVQENPALRFRILWTWDHSTNWTTGVRGFQEDGARNPYEKSPQVFVEDYKKVIDFMSAHKLNGLIIWGFLRDRHKGISAAQELVQYANERGVRILPGVGTEYYGGFYYEGEHKFNVDTWLSRNPKTLSFLDTQGKRFPNAICPSKSANQQWLREGAQWLFSTFPGLGGVNLENGDFMSCQTLDCRQARQRRSNDPNYYWDMMATQVPIIEAASKMDPKAWFIYATYTGFAEGDVWSRTPRDKIRRQMPRFVNQYPEFAVCQWTYSNMVSKQGQSKPDPSLWPMGVRPPTQHSIGLLHQGSQWWKGSHWWCATPEGNNVGGRYDEIVDIIQYTVRRAHGAGMEGVEILGEVSPTSPQNELNYLALEEFCWHPNQSMNGFVENRLSRFYGGSELAKRFVKFVLSDEESPKRLIDRYGQAQELAQNSALTYPQRKRWGNLAREIARRLSVASTVQRSVS